MTVEINVFILVGAFVSLFFSGYVIGVTRYTIRSVSRLTGGKHS